MPSPFAHLLIMLTCSLAAPIAVAQDDDGDSPHAPGLWAEYRDETRQSPPRVDETIAFAWRGASPDTALNSGRFSAKWRGYLMSEADGNYRLHVHACGKVHLRLNGVQVLESESTVPSWTSSQPLPLTFAWHPLELEYESGGGESRLALYWTGPNFDLEPIDERHLYHDAQPVADPRLERGRQLARVLRCEACHTVAGATISAIAAPDLTFARKNILPSWLSDHLSRRGRSIDTPTIDLTERKMPFYALNEGEVNSLMVYLSDGRERTGEPAGEPIADTDVQEGRRLFLTTGCLACHGYESFGNAGLFGGGDLSRIGRKRPPGFFAEWLANPEKVNPRHRMPVFELSVEERRRLALFLASLTGAADGPSSSESRGNAAPKPPIAPAADPGALAATGAGHFRRLGCAHCHDGPPAGAESDKNMSYVKPLDASARWDRSCAGSPRDQQPGFDLAPEDAESLRTYFSERRSGGDGLAEPGRLVLEERNCVSCHARGAHGGIGAQLARVLEAFPDLSPSIAAMSPPSLNSIGDKLHDEALRKAIRREGPVRRPWLLVRMPKASLANERVAELANYLIDKDRIPDEAPWRRKDERSEIDARVGGRLVTPDGFGCTSCHSIGKVKAPNAPINTTGPDLLMMGDRIRRPWFDRWVRSPARIVPRMEMPSVQTPVRGLLDENLDEQLASVWHLLNRPDFRPPEPNPIRVVRRSGRAEDHERAVVLTDVLRTETRTYIKSLLIALPSRDNLLFDLEEGRWAAWWIGDAARQRTKGKAWYWDAAGTDLWQANASEPEWELEWKDRRFAPVRIRQFVTEFDELLQPSPDEVELRYRLHFDLPRDDSTPPTRFVVRARQSFRTTREPGKIERRVRLDGLPPGTRGVFHLMGRQGKELWREVDSQHVESMGDDQAVVWSLAGDQPLNPRADERTVAVAERDGHCEIHITYARKPTVDEFPSQDAVAVPQRADSLRVAPGFEVRRLPLPDEWMPTCLAWNDEGQLIVGSLKGQLWRASDTNGDGLEDSLSSLGVELAAPYGLASGPGYLDVVNKYAVLRLFDDDRDGLVDRMVNIASGWSHTDDYHDWAIGLPPDGVGGYFVALPCQQDDRAADAAYLRGAVTRLAAREPTVDNPRLFEIEPLSTGHRFPMGIARNREGDLFVSDNQGNFNPFNELNHVRPGAHYGFINAIDVKSGIAPRPLTPPTINIPHPWTRSVNGICFLEHPSADVEATAFGPFAGHLIGCEFDTQRLIRMSLQRIGETLQGATYPLTVEYPPEGSPILGPINCAVSPSGDIYVASLRDSGWGGANNIGEVVRLRLLASELPAGIAEVRATSTGFEIEFTRPIDEIKAARPDNYVVASYRRVSTPAYGGPDVDRRSEPVHRVTVSDDHHRARLELAELRTGFVYEFHLRNLAVGEGVSFFPAEAYYTLWVKYSDVPAPEGHSSSTHRGP